MPITTVLVANRGEIAVRIVRACRDRGLGTVAVYSDCDRDALHVRLADRAFALEGNTAAETYLRIDVLVDVARRSGADAVHPGYGFLAENEEFAAACADAGLVFIGPSADAIALMGSKTAARDVARRAGVPLVPGSDGPLPDGLDDTALRRVADTIGFPLLVKAVAGGGGKGMRTVQTAADLSHAVRAAKSEAGSAFGDSAVYFERQIVRPRHIEVQLLGDRFGTVQPFVERECSIQRRHQKVVEESPSPVMTTDLRRRMAAAARSIAETVGYTNAGTIEFLVDASGGFYFLEMNTRLQVEHPVTEMVTGIDLVEWQLRIAAGERLTIDPARALDPRGHAIECRVYAEDPDRGFLPSPGRIVALRQPSGPGIRDDSCAVPGYDVPVYYDSLISKLVAWGEDRPQATARLRRALREYEIHGIRTTIPFFSWLLAQADFEAGAFDTTYLDRLLAVRAGDTFATPSEDDETLAVVAAAITAHRRAGRQAAGGLSSGARSAWTQAGRLSGLR
ncbi:MAG: acetyl-CoA carboxylase biotin carboxylase subunit [Vicinamibacterales bacterium]